MTLPSVTGADSTDARGSAKHAVASTNESSGAQARSLREAKGFELLVLEVNGRRGPDFRCKQAGQRHELLYVMASRGHEAFLVTSLLVFNSDMVPGRPINAGHHRVVGWLSAMEPNAGVRG